MSMYYVNWQIINHAMKKKQLTDQKLANLLGVKRVTLVLWRKNRTGPLRGDPLLLDKLCDILEINKDVILHDETKLPTILYEELLEGMLAVVKLDHLIDSNISAFENILGKERQKLLTTYISGVRELTAYVYLQIENSKKAVTEIQGKRGRPKKAPTTVGDGEEHAG